MEKEQDVFSKIVKVEKNMGKKLVIAAEEEFKKKRGENIVAQVTTLMHDLKTARGWEQKNREAAEMIEAKLAAIKAGEFEFDVNDQIVFKSDRLNKRYPHDLGFNS
jgi:hypothetical protein